MKAKTATLGRPSLQPWINFKMAPHHKQWATQFEQSLIDVKRLLEQTVERQAAAPVFLTSLGAIPMLLATQSRYFAQAPASGSWRLRFRKKVRFGSSTEVTSLRLSSPPAPHASYPERRTVRSHSRWRHAGRRAAGLPMSISTRGGKATVRKFAHAPSVPGTAAGD